MADNTIHSTTLDPAAIATRFCDAAVKELDYLAARWQDEREYEHIEDYAQPLCVIAAAMPGTVTVVAMHKRPFGCTFEVRTPTHPRGAFYTIKVNAKSITLVEAKPRRGRS